MISIVLAITLLSAYFIPLKQEFKVLYLLGMILVIGVFEVTGLLTQQVFATDQMLSFVVSVAVVHSLAFLYLVKEASLKSSYLAPLPLLLFALFKELGIFRPEMSLVICLLVFVSLSPKGLRGEKAISVLPYLGFLAISLSIFKLVGPLDSEIVGQIESNLILGKYRFFTFNTFYLWAIVSTGIQLTREIKSPQPFQLFLLMNLFFSYVEISTTTYLLVFLIMSLYVLFTRSKRILSDLVPLFYLFVFQTFPNLPLLLIPVLVVLISLPQLKFLIVKSKANLSWSTFVLAMGVFSFFLVDTVFPKICIISLVFLSLIVVRTEKGEQCL